MKKKFAAMLLLAASILFLFCPPVSAQMQSSHIKRAQIYLQAGDYENARDILEAVKEAGDFDMDTFFLLGLAYRGLKEYEKSETAFQQVIGYDQKFEMAYIHLAAVQMESGRPEEAEKTIARVFAFNPKSAYAHYASGVIFYQRGDLLRASREFNAAVLSDKNFAAAYGNLGIVYYNRNQLKEAAESFQKAADLEKMEPRYLFYLGWVNRDLKEQKRAYSFFQRAANLRAPSAYSVTWKIIQAFDEGNYEKAKEHIEELNHIDKDFDKGRYLLSLILIKEEKFNEAGEILSGLIEEDPNDRDAKETLNNIRPNLQEIGTQKPEEDELEKEIKNILEDEKTQEDKTQEESKQDKIHSDESLNDETKNINENKKDEDHINNDKDGTKDTPIDK